MENDDLQKSSVSLLIIIFLLLLRFPLLYLGIFKDGIIMTEDLLNDIGFHGDRGVVFPFSCINEIKKDMTTLSNGDFHTDWLNRMVNHS